MQSAANRKPFTLTIAYQLKKYSVFLKNAYLGIEHWRGIFNEWFIIGIGSNEKTRPLGPTLFAMRRVHSPIFAPVSITVFPGLLNFSIICSGI